MNAGTLREFLRLIGDPVVITAIDVSDRSGPGEADTLYVPVYSVRSVYWNPNTEEISSEPKEGFNMAVLIE